MAGLYLQGACIDSAETEKGRWVVNDRCGGEMSGTVVCEDVGAEPQRGICAGGVDKVLENPKSLRKRVYDTMYVLSSADREQQEMRVVRQNPATDWKRVWTNRHGSGTAETITAVWYVIIREILPTNVTLHIISLADTPCYKKCGD
jgi:hypothetical protein